METDTTSRILAAIEPAIRRALQNASGEAASDDAIPEGTEQRAAILRAMRAYCGIDQATVAEGTGLSPRTIGYAEKGHGVSVRAWEKCMAFFAAKGLTWDGRAIVIASQGA